MAENAVFEDSGMINLVAELMLDTNSEHGMVCAAGDFCYRWLHWGDSDTKIHRRREFLTKYRVVERIRPQIARMSRRPKAAAAVMQVVLEIVSGFATNELVERCEMAADQGAIDLAAAVLEDTTIALTDEAAPCDATLLLAYCSAGAV